MPLIYRGEGNAGCWAVWKITESEAELWKEAKLSSEEATRVRRIVHERRRLESLAARAARARLNPFPHFSLSHSNPWAAAATSPHPIAIDIERLRPFPPAVWHYFTQESERQREDPPSFTKWHFWCAKELSYKLLCQEFDKISFRRELSVWKDRVEFRRGEIYREIALFFVETQDWLLAVGWLK
ncbi:MAG: 4'-phosphopantetheinyl transferase superfamily protein [Bacteroidia bacterium]|nr:4'-phosphopantetheinyl transferase superfamily protein [Bacteroidia bacterium]MDW8236113.1 hypothetical protein [Bacteroidia bacterium]